MSTSARLLHALRDRHDRPHVIFTLCTMFTALQHDSTCSLLVVSAGGRRAFILSEVGDALAASSGIADIGTLIAAANVSPRSVVEEFGSESELVTALADELTAAMIEPLDAGATEESFQSTLFAFGTRMTDETLNLKFRRLNRIALEGNNGDNSLLSDLYRRGPGLVTSELARFIEDGQAGGYVREEDSALLANHLMALLNAVSSSDVKTAIELFCSGVQIEVSDACASV